MNDGMIEVGSEEGMRFGFTADRFQPHSYLWRQGNTIIVSFIASVNPRRGAFRQLVEEIRRQGFRVAVPTPLGRMQEIVIKNGYKHEVQDTEHGACDVWILEAS